MTLREYDERMKRYFAYYDLGWVEKFVTTLVGSAYVAEDLIKFPVRVSVVEDHDDTRFVLGDRGGRLLINPVALTRTNRSVHGSLFLTYEIKRAVAEANFLSIPDDEGGLEDVDDEVVNDVCEMGKGNVYTVVRTLCLDESVRTKHREAIWRIKCSGPKSFSKFCRAVFDKYYWVFYPAYDNCLYLPLIKKITTRLAWLERKQADVEFCGKGLSDFERLLVVRRNWKKFLYLPANEVETMARVSLLTSYGYDHWDKADDFVTKNRSLLYVDEGYDLE
jgi:hypothetical protein